jgi:hypothetical protein
VLAHHQRIQHPVGQGFFHSGDISWSDGSKFSYVYDCGSLPTYRGARNKAIRDYRNKRTEIDILYVSHAHADHVTGLPELLKDITPGAVFMPFLDPIERLWAFAHSVTDHVAVASDGFYRSFTIDPVQAVGDLGADAIFEVTGDGEGGAPGAGEGPISGLPAEEPMVFPGEGRTWRLIGRGRDGGERTITALGKEITVTTIPHTTGVLIGPSGKSPVSDAWLFAHYIDKSINSDRVKFTAILEKKTGLTYEQICDPVNMKKLITDDILNLKDAYDRVAKNLNFTSLSLYSGPLRSPSSRHYHRITLRGGNTARLYLGNGQVSWLGTGDADLKTKKRRKPFLTHFGKLADNVATLTIPHHGSENNFDKDIIEKINPDLAVVAAAPYSKWRHPGTKVVQAIATQGIPLAVVTHGKHSKLIECVRFR